MKWYASDPRVGEVTPVAVATGLSVDSLLFVLDALDVAPQYSGDEPGDVCDEVRHSSAAELCRCIPWYARHLFGKKWQDALREMKIFASEDLGKVTYALVTAGLLEATADDRIEDFAQVCRFIEVSKD